MTSQGAPEPATALIAALLYNFAAASLISNSLNGCAMLLTSAMLLDVSDSGYCVCLTAAIVFVSSILRLGRSKENKKSLSYLRAAKSQRQSAPLLT